MHLFEWYGNGLPIGAQERVFDTKTADKLGLKSGIRPAEFSFK